MGDDERLIDETANELLNDERWNPDVPMGLRRALVEDGFDPRKPVEVPPPPTDEELLERSREHVACWSVMPAFEAVCIACPDCKTRSFDVIYKECAQLPRVNGKVDTSKFTNDGWVAMTTLGGMLKRCAKHSEPALPWAKDLDPVKVRDWLRPQLGGEAFEIDFEDLRRSCS